MFRSVFAKSLWDGRRGTVGWVVGMVALAVFLVAMYPVLRDSPAIGEFIESFPPEALALFGIDPAVYQTGFGFLQAQLYSFAAPILLVTLAVGIGSSATAREEEEGTADLLLTAPISRRRLVAEKAAAMAVLTAVVAATLAVVLMAAGPVVDLSLSIAGIVAVNGALWLLSLLFGAVAMLVGASSGRRAMAAGVAGGLAAASFFWNGLAPVSEALEQWRFLSPFHWYLADEPLRAGPTAWHGVLAAAVVALVTATIAVFDRRDVGVARRLLPRLRRRTGPGDERGSRSVSRLLHSPFGRTLWERRVSIWYWVLGLAALSGLTIAFWPTIASGSAGAGELIEAIPREMLALFGITEPAALLTGPGFVSSRVYSSVGMVIVVALSIGLGAAATAEEERDGTADLVLSTPIGRRRFVVDQLLAMLTLVGIVVASLFAVLWVGDAAVDLGLTIEGSVAGTMGLGLLALIFGTLAMAVGSATGRPGTATGVATAAAASAFFMNGLGALVDGLAPLRAVSPFYWYQGDSTPLTREIGPALLLLAAVALALAVAAVALFERRDIGT